METKSEENLETLLKHKTEEAASAIKLYKIRWFILLLFVLYAASSAMQWIQYCVISDVIMKYYGVSALAVDWTSLISMVTYPPLIIPGSFIIDKMGLRVCALLGVIGTTIGTWVKVFSVQPHLFWVGFAGQTIVFVSQIFILSLPPRIASLWFGPNEVTYLRARITACSLGVFGTQLGTAVGFIAPPYIVQNSDNLEEIGDSLSLIFKAVAWYTTPIAILVILYFKSEPEVAPSQAQLDLRRKH
ncbi:PREDICTED: uncharacterized MFS-type transporter C09D4.1-like, partial [Nicrophorus vespilloides]|uniref:Uncharacterized MFS-type transporter C09D4.1-like n=1 Tax=Nicrophorus vespilloides TaxID=110193 RepID=A0ABM1MPL3_NICVS